MTDEIDYFEGTGPAPAEPMTLKRLTELAEEARGLSREIAMDAAAIQAKQEALNNIVRNRLPEAMETLGMKKFELSDGSKIEVKENLNASIKEENKLLAYSWLEAHGFDGIIKTSVSAAFGKGEIEEARKALQALEDAGFSGSMERGIHASTLKAFVRERLEEGEEIPLDIFGIFEFKEAKITPAKSARLRSRR